jgi:hypothetical protein
VAWSASWYVVLLLASGVVNAVLAFVVWTNRDRRAAGPAMAFFCVMALWAFADAVRVGFTDPGAQFFWYRVAITPAGAVATLWLVFALVYAGYEDVLTRPVLALLSVKPVTYVALAWTNGAHHLVWTDVWLLAGASPPNLAFAFGPVYVVHIVYAYLLVVAGVGVLLDTARRSAATGGCPSRPDGRTTRSSSSWPTTGRGSRPSSARRCGGGPSRRSPTARGWACGSPAGSWRPWAGASRSPRATGAPRSPSASPRPRRSDPTVL